VVGTGSLVVVGGKEPGWLVEGRFWFGDVRKGWR
jgi:hypothetical protein